VSGPDLLADGLIYFGAMLWSLLKCLALGALVAVPCLWAWSLCVVSARADEEAQRLWEERDRSS
jgi:hypothetical protein